MAEQFSIPCSGVLYSIAGEVKNKKSKIQNEKIFGLWTCYPSMLLRVDAGWRLQTCSLRLHALPCCSAVLRFQTVVIIISVVTNTVEHGGRFIFVQSVKFAHHFNVSPVFEDRKPYSVE